MNAIVEVQAILSNFLNICFTSVNFYIVPLDRIVLGSGKYMEEDFYVVLFIGSLFFVEYYD